MRAQVKKEVVDVAHDIPVIAERWHHELGSRLVPHAAAGDNAEEGAVVHRLERICERRRVGRAQAIGAMADVTLGMIAAIPVIRTPAVMSVPSFLQMWNVGVPSGNTDLPSSFLAPSW